MRVLLLLSFSLWIATFPASARADEIALTFQEAESLAVQNSNTLKAVHSDWQAADYQTAAQFQSLLPRLSIVGNYQYANYIPQVSIGPGPAIPFGTNSTYSVGPAVSYTVWDGLSSRRLYHSASLLAEARDQDVKSAKRQVLLSVRSAYIQVQLGVEELRLIQGSLDLARAQNRDVDIRFKAGSATRLDVVTSQRAVLSFEIQFKQRQANLSLSLRDLMTLLGRHESKISLGLGHRGRLMWIMWFASILFQSCSKEKARKDFLKPILFTRPSALKSFRQRLMSLQQRVSRERRGPPSKFRGRSITIYRAFRILRNTGKRLWAFL